MCNGLPRHVTILRIAIIPMHCRWSRSSHLILRLIGKVREVVLRSRALKGILRLIVRRDKHVWDAIRSTVIWCGLMLKMRGLRVYRSIWAGK